MSVVRRVVALENSFETKFSDMAEFKDTITQYGNLVAMSNEAYKEQYINGVWKQPTFDDFRHSISPAVSEDYEIASQEDIELRGNEQVVTLEELCMSVKENSDGVYDTSMDEAFDFDEPVSTDEGYDGDESVSTDEGYDGDESVSTDDDDWSDSDESVSTDDDWSDSDESVETEESEDGVEPEEVDYADDWSDSDESVETEESEDGVEPEEVDYDDDWSDSDESVETEESEDGVEPEESDISSEYGWVDESDESESEEPSTEISDNDNDVDEVSTEPDMGYIDNSGEITEADIANSNSVEEPLSAEPEHETTIAERIAARRKALLANMPQVSTEPSEPVEPSPVEVEPVEPSPVEVEPVFEPKQEEPPEFGSKDDEPAELRAFLRKHPKCPIDIVLKYFSKKEVDTYIRLGKVVKRGNTLRV